MAFKSERREIIKELSDSASLIEGGARFFL
jgi:hypothetical protein